MSDLPSRAASARGRLSLPSIRLVGRVGWAVIDQGFVSLANFGLGVVVARLVSPTEFGAFGVAFTVYLVVLNVARGFAILPLTIRFGGDPTEFRRGAAEATGVAFAIGVGGSVVCLAIAVLVGGLPEIALAALAAALPGLLVQDAWRFVLFTSRRGPVAIINDLVATVVMATFIVMVVAFDTVSVFTMVLCWGGGGTAAALVGILQTKIRPEPSRTIRWCREHWDITPQFLGSELTQMGGGVLVLFALGTLVDLAAVGSIRGAQLLLGPAYVLYIGVHLSMIPEAARLTGSLVRFRRIALFSSTALAVAGAGWGLVLLLLPDSVGRESPRGQLAGGSVRASADFAVGYYPARDRRPEDWASRAQGGHPEPASERCPIRTDDRWRRQRRARRRHRRSSVGIGARHLPGRDRLVDGVRTVNATPGRPQQRSRRRGIRRRAARNAGQRRSYGASDDQPGES